MRIGKKEIAFRMSAATITKIALLAALSYALYFLKFNLPVIFPSFLEFQFSEIPAIFAGFSMGPVAGVLVVVFKCLLKLPLSSTAYVGELTDILVGIAYVLPASIIYRLHKDRKHALIGLGVSILCQTGVAILLNRYVSVPLYIQLYFGGDFSGLLNICSVLYPNATEGTFYAYYLGIGVLPFNVLRALIMSLIAVLLYKRLSPLLHWGGEGLRRKGIQGEYDSFSEEDTFELARKVADTLKGGETIHLTGDLGAGKTTFVKGLGEALNIKEEITSPTFTLLNVYTSGRLPLYHADMYRVADEDEIEELGLFEDAPIDAVRVIEWNKSSDLTRRVIGVTITSKEDGIRHFIVSDTTNK